MHFDSENIAALTQLLLAAAALIRSLRARVDHRDETADFERRMTGGYDPVAPASAANEPEVTQRTCRRCGRLHESRPRKT